MNCATLLGLGWVVPCCASFVVVARWPVVDPATRSPFYLGRHRNRGCGMAQRENLRRWTPMVISYS
jgi:hypothetical protein